MCGIAGFLNAASDPDARQTLARMVASLVHRGPDDEGAYLDDQVALGNRRLSIIDLSSAARQPMATPDGSIRLVFNGEIYNYRELDELLTAKGYAYTSRSDTETIVHAYEEWGLACVERFNGMFAFALWDARRRQLFCARDRFGEKPFYYTTHDGRFRFASEIKALLQDRAVPRAPNPRVLCRYLAHNLTDVDEETFFDGIRALPPAHTLLVRDGRVTIARYWRLPACTPARHGHPATETDAIEAFKAALKESVRLRLRSDVPVGTCLSGGLDSSSIVCVISDIQGAPLSAFSVLYDDREHAEGAYVEAVEGAVGLPVHRVMPTGGDLLDVLPRLIWHNDEPSSSFGLYSQWHVMKLASEGGVKVILNGQGGDELLAGYHRYTPTRVREILRAGRAGLAWRELHASRVLQGRAAGDILRQAVYPSVPAAMRRVYARCFSARTHAQEFISPDLVPPGRSAWNGVPAFRTLAEHLAHDLTVASVPALLHHEDRASMAFGREIRLPFLDPGLVEMATALPASLKVRDGVTKYVLRRAMAGEGVPATVLARHDKKGYPTPMGKWFATTAREGVRDILSSSSFAGRGVVRAEAARRGFDRHVTGADDLTLQIWQWINVELWFRRFMDPPVITADGR